MRPFGDAIRYPTEHEDWLKTVAIGGILTLVSFLVVPVFLVYGYVVRVIRENAGGPVEPPAFDDWGELLVDGLQMFVISIIYMLIPLVVGAVTVGGAVATAVAAGEPGVPAQAIGGVVLGLALTFLLVLVFGYVAIAGIVNFAREETFTAAFDFGTIVDVITTSDYAVAWLLSVVVFVGVAIVNGILGLIPVLGAILGAFVGFYGWVVAAVIWTDGVSDAIGDGGGDSGEEPPGVEWS